MKVIQHYLMIGFVSVLTSFDLISSHGAVKFLLAHQQSTRYCIKAPCDQPKLYGYYYPASNTAKVNNKEYQDIVFQKITNNVPKPALNQKTENYSQYVYLGVYESSTPCPPGQMCIALYQPTKFGVFGILVQQEGRIDEQEEEVVSHVRLGSSSATWSPVVFEPSTKFSGTGLVGNYFAATAIATIHNPTNAEQSKSYSFTQVVESDVKKRHTGKRYVGQLSNGKFLYGKLQAD